MWSLLVTTVALCSPYLIQGLNLCRYVSLHPTAFSWQASQLSWNNAIQNNQMFGRNNNPAAFIVLTSQALSASIKLLVIFPAPDWDGPNHISHFVIKTKKKACSHDSLKFCLISPVLHLQFNFKLQFLTASLFFQSHCEVSCCTCTHTSEFTCSVKFHTVSLSHCQINSSLHRLSLPLTNSPLTLMNTSLIYWSCDSSLSPPPSFPFFCLDLITQGKQPLNQLSS